MEFKMASLHKCLLIGFLLGLMTEPCLSIRCLQCNMRQRGVMNTCEAPREMPDCIGCMKTITKIKIRDSGYITGKEKLSEVVSRYCMRDGATNVQREGCYKQRNNGGYTERCYCYSDMCNAGSTVMPSSRFASITAFILPLITTVILRIFYST